MTSESTLEDVYASLVFISPDSYRDWDIGTLAGRLAKVWCSKNRIDALIIRINMLFIISGSSRSGKTLIAKKILAERGIPYLSLDWLVMGFTNGIPEYGIHDKLFPDEIAERSWSFLKAMFESMIYVDAHCVIEGEAILPELIVELKEKYPEKLRICFIGYTDITVDQKVTDIKNNSDGERDWLMDNSDEYIKDHVKNMIAHSKMIKKSCQDCNIRYFDTSKSFRNAIADSMDYLLA